MKHIVLIEDDDGHAELLSRNLQRSGISDPIIRLKDGEAGLAYIHSILDQSTFNNAQLIVLLDINMPRLNGFDVLKRIKARDRTAGIPIIVLSTTDDPKDVAIAYRLGCNVYITKPVGYEQFVEVTHRLGGLLQVMKAPEFNYGTGIARSSHG